MPTCEHYVPYTDRASFLVLVLNLFAICEFENNLQRWLFIH